MAALLAMACSEPSTTGTTGADAGSDVTQGFFFDVSGTSDGVTVDSLGSENGPDTIAANGEKDGGLDAAGPDVVAARLSTKILK